MKRMLWLSMLISVSLFSMVPELDAQRRGRNRRGGDSDGLQVGEMAPTFVLQSLDGDSETDLASFQGDKPVVLFFGSYT